MRVLHARPQRRDRGSSIRALSLARWLARTGRELTVLSARLHAGTSERAARAEDGVRVVEPPDVLPLRLRNGGLSPVDLAGRLLHVRGERYDVVHSFEPRPCATVPAVVARRAGSVYVADWADLWGPQGMAALWPAPAAADARRLRRSLAGVYTRRKADAVTVIGADLERRAEALGDPLHADPTHPDRRQRRPLHPGAVRRSTQPARSSTRRAGRGAHRFRPFRRAAARGYVCCGLAARATRLPAHVGEGRSSSCCSAQLQPVPRVASAMWGVVPCADHGVGDRVRGRHRSAVRLDAAQRGPLPEPRWRLPRRRPPGGHEPDGGSRGRGSRRSGSGSPFRLRRSRWTRDRRAPSPAGAARRDGPAGPRPRRNDVLVAGGGRRRLAELYEELAQAEAVAGPRSWWSS